MQNKVSISAIVPIYNVENYLSKCLDSLRNQSFHDFEVVLVNDGSKDGSKSIAQMYAKKYPNFHYFEKLNGGLSDARNFGIKQAMGDFVAFIDADDYIDESMFEKMITRQKNTHADIVACDMLYVYENGRTEVAIAGDFEIIDVKKNLAFIDMNNSACNKLFRKSLFDDLEFPVGKLYEDLFIVPLLIYKANLVARVAEPLYMYYQRKGSIVHANNPKMFHIYEAIDHVQKGLLELDVKKEVLNPIINRMLIKHGLFLTTLRIKENGTFLNRVHFFKMNMNEMNKRYTSWNRDATLNEYPFKSRIIFKFLHLRLYPIVALILKRSK